MKDGGLNLRFVVIVVVVFCLFFAGYFAGSFRGGGGGEIGAKDSLYMEYLRWRIGCDSMVYHREMRFYGGR